VVAQNFRSDCRGRQSAHVGKLYFLIFEHKNKTFLAPRTPKRLSLLALAFNSIEINIWSSEELKAKS
jgi:hypothetical protein